MDNTNRVRIACMSAIVGFAVAVLTLAVFGLFSFAGKRDVAQKKTASAEPPAVVETPSLPPSRAPSTSPQPPRMPVLPWPSPDDSGAASPLFRAPSTWNNATRLEDQFAAEMRAAALKAFKVNRIEDLPRAYRHPVFGLGALFFPQNVRKPLETLRADYGIPFLGSAYEVMAVLSAESLLMYCVEGYFSEEVVTIYHTKPLTVVRPGTDSVLFRVFSGSVLSRNNLDHASTHTWALLFYYPAGESGAFNVSGISVDGRLIFENGEVCTKLKEEIRGFSF